MKRSIFIIIGIIIILLLLAVWIYVLFFGSPKNIEDTFTRFGFGDTTDPAIVIEDPVVEEETRPAVDVASDEKLKQLTTKQVIGYQEVRKSTTSEPLIYFVESGTGHIFSINLKSGEEERVSGTTIPESNKAAITPDGEYAMIQSGSGANKKTTLGKIRNGSLDSVVLNEDINDFVSSENNTFLYSSKTTASTIGKEFYPISNVYETLFTVPFRESVINWGKSKKDTHYIYPKSSSLLEGFLYKAKDGLLTRTPIDGFGLSAYGNNDHIIFSRQDSNNYRSFIRTEGTIKSSLSPITVLPEKCTSDRIFTTYFYCAQSEGKFNETYPDVWYRGEVTFADLIWKIDTKSMGATILMNTKTVSGRNIDIIEPTSSTNNLYFKNKIDNTLWLLELN